MRKLACTLLFVFSITLVCSGQKKVYKVEVASFFDNTEFGHSKVQMPQTMAGVHLAPEIGLSWDSIHRVFIGVNLLHEFGSDKAIDYYDPTAYYEYNFAPLRFYMGAFPRNEVLEKYPRMFFQDSINNYRPNINGLFWEIYKNDSYFNVWLDWTSRQTFTRHEAFFMGWSGRTNLGIFYAQHFGYMFHFAGTMNPAIDEALHDNGLMLTSLGIDLAKKTNFEKLEVNAGWTVGLERARAFKTWYTPQGLLVETKIEYKGLGLFNSYYKGGSQQVFYNDHGNELYWGDPIYRAQEYDRADFYIRFFESDVVKTKFMYSMHFAENTIYHEQSLYVTFDINNLEKKKKAPYQYFWSNWIR